MGKYKLIACDLDGTLADPEGKVSRENREAIRMLKEKGIEFVPCTGRTLCEMADIAGYEDIRYIITSNGAVTEDKKENKKDFMCLDKLKLEKVLDVVLSADGYTVIHADGQSYTDARLAGKHREYGISENIHCLLVFAEYITDFNVKAYEFDCAESICVFFRTIKEAEECAARLSDIVGISVVSGIKAQIEIFSDKTGKGNALICLAEKLGIMRDEIIAIGDSGNDISMLEAAGCGIAVSNACEKLKSIADEIICSNNENAVQFVLNNIIK